MNKRKVPLFQPFLEARKLKKTGFLPAFLGGGLLAAFVPVVNMMVRAETFTSQPGSPFRILMDANWQLMAQLNIFLLVCGACILYHTEYADNCLQKAQSLPMRPSALFLGKFTVLAVSCLLPLCVEALSLLLCCAHWFPGSTDTGRQLFAGMAFELVLLLPTGTAMLLLSSMCRNMWISLGAGVILMFFSSMLPTGLSSGSAVMALMPFASPYRMPHQFSGEETMWMCVLCMGEVLFFCAAERIYQTIRRCFS